jgi:hypothetical protein
MLLDQGVAERPLVPVELHPVLLEHLAARTGLSQLLPLGGQPRDPLAQLFDFRGPVPCVGVHAFKRCANDLSIACGKRQERSATSEEPFHGGAVERQPPVEKALEDVQHREARVGVEAGGCEQRRADVAREQ